MQAKLTTLIGAPESNGLHWIIAGDGFTPAELPQFREAARDLVSDLLQAPELAAHTPVWNVHVLEVGSPESGVDVAETGTYVDTAFDGRLGCGSNSRVACVDWDKVSMALRDLGAPAAEITVLLNTSEYVGSSNSSGIIVSRNAHAPRITAHEMGHRVAGLADEYVDAQVADEWRPLYFEGRFPNVTTVTDPDHVPWRHWLADPAVGVGLYEGAFYIPNGFYRPTPDSLMRTLEAPIGEVNAEAWLRAQYRALPPLTEVSPAAPHVQALAGETLEFSVVSPWPRTAVTLRWFVDGAEVAAARDAASFQFAADGGMHRVEVRACDATGRIRAPDAREAQGGYTWQVSPEAPSSDGKLSPPRGMQAWLRVRVDGTGHRVVERLPADALPRLAPHAEADWRYSLLGRDGSVLASGVVADPRVARSTISAPGEAQAGHSMAILESGVYLVGIPAGVQPGKLRLAATAAGKEKLARSGLVTDDEIEIGLAGP